MFLRIDPKRAGIAGAAAMIVAVLLGVVWFRISGAVSAPESILDKLWTSLSGRLASGRMPQLLLLTAIVLGSEILVVGWRKSSIYRLSVGARHTAITDVLFFVTALLSLNGLLAIVLTLGLSVGATGIVNWIVSQYGWSRIDLPTDGPLQLAFGFSVYWLAISFIGYWGHRLMHTPWLWHLHRFHHSATELNMITGFRQHPLEPVILSFVGLVSPLVFFNVSDQILFIAFVWGTTFDFLAHSQLPWEYGWFGRWIVACPRVHQIHHSTADEHRDMNFSNFPLWDHVFGTWYRGDSRPAAYGIPDNGYEARPFRQFVLDAFAFYSAVVRGLGESLVRSLRIAG